MKLHMLAMAISASFLLNACAPKSKGSAPAAEASADAEGEGEESEAIMTSEHCVDDKASACFIEKEVDGREQFYTTDAYNKILLTNQGLQESNIVLQVIPDAEYQKMATETIVPRMLYGKAIDVNLDVVNEDGSPKALVGRDDSANILPVLALLRNASKLKKLSGLLKGGKSLGRLKGVLGKGGGKGIFARIFGKRKSGGGFFKELAINLGLGVLFSGLGSGDGDVDPGKGKNARADARSKPLELPYEMRLGEDLVQEDVTID